MTLCVCWQGQSQSIQEGREYAWNGAKCIAQRCALEWKHRLMMSGGWSNLDFEWNMQGVSNLRRSNSTGWCLGVCLNFIPEEGNAQLYSSGKAGIWELCLWKRYINSISLRQLFYLWMIKDMVCWICLRRVMKKTAILLWN
jgi:hypothetical protein